MSVSWGELRLLFLVVVAGLSFVAGVGQVHAQTANQQNIDKLIRQQRQIIQDQEQRRRKQLEDLRKSPNVKRAEEQALQDLKASGKVCLPIRKINFKGAELLNKRKQTAKAIKKVFLRKKCLTIIDIMTVVKVVTNWYIERGYITARAYPPEQDLSKKVLTIKVIEGRTEAVDIFENGMSRRGLNTAFPRIIGKRLYIRDVEQGLDQINRLATHDAKIRIEPGKKEGYSRLRVDTAKTLGVVTRKTFDNHGLSSTGDYQVGGNVQVNDVFGLYSSLSLGHKSSRPFAKGASDNWSNEYSVGLSMPLGYWTAFLSGSYHEYSSLLRGGGLETPTSGKSVYYSAELDRVIHRDRLSKTRISAFMNYKDTESYIVNVLNNQGTRKLNVAGARVSHSRRIWGGLLDVGLDGQWGAPLFGSLSNDKRQGTTLDAEFAKVSANFRFYRPLRVGKSVLGITVSGAGQFSEDDLFGSEQISIGGLYSVRGYKDNSLAGDTGGYIRNEVFWALPNYLKGTSRKLFGNMKLFAAYDVGWIEDESHRFDPAGKLSGMAAGVKLEGGWLYGEAAYEKALDAPDGFEKEDEIFRFNVGMRVRW